MWLLFFFVPHKFKRRKLCDGRIYAALHSQKKLGNVISKWVIWERESELSRGVVESENHPLKEESPLVDAFGISLTPFIFPSSAFMSGYSTGMIKIVGKINFWRMNRDALGVPPSKINFSCCRDHSPLTFARFQRCLLLLQIWYWCKSRNVWKNGTQSGQFRAKVSSKKMMLRIHWESENSPQPMVKTARKVNFWRRNRLIWFLKEERQAHLG